MLGYADACVLVCVVCVSFINIIFLILKKVLFQKSEIVVDFVLGLGIIIIWVICLSLNTPISEETHRILEH